MKKNYIYNAVTIYEDGNMSLNPTGWSDSIAGAEEVAGRMMLMRQASINRAAIGVGTILPTGFAIVRLETVRLKKKKTKS